MINRLLTGTAAAAVAACAATSIAVASPFVPRAQAIVAPAAATAPVRFTVHIPLHHRAELETLARLQGSKGSQVYRHFLTPAQFRDRYGVTPADVASVRAAFAPYGLRVAAVGTQDVIVTGGAANVERALGTSLGMTVVHGASRVVAKTAIRLPAALGAATVVGLSTAVLRHTHSELLRPSTAAIVAGAELGARPHNDISPLGGYFTSDLKEAYQYPSYRSLTGKGATVAILVDGDFFDADMRTYFGIQNLPVPTLVRRPVDGGADTSDPDNVETELDIQQAGGMAPGATIVHYNIPDLSDTSVYDGYKAIVDDNRADVVNSSFGGCERYYNGTYVGYLGPTAIPATLYALTELFLQGALQGQSFVASSGDYGAIACFKPSAFQTFNPDFTPIAGVEHPASDNFVAAVGGTNLVTSFDASSAASSASTYVRENAFGDQPNPRFPLAWGSGGGESTLYKRPPWQDTIGITSAGRAVPDISGHMGGCPGFAAQPCGPDRSSDLIAYGGGFFNVLGTSASSPDFAGLLALTVEASGSRLGIISPTIYAYSAANGKPITYYHDNVDGDNGLGAQHRPTKPGYDEVTGVGSVIGLPFTGLLTAEVAGDPGTPSNPGVTPGSDALPVSATPSRAAQLSFAIVDESLAKPLATSTASTRRRSAGASLASVGTPLVAREATGRVVRGAGDTIDTSGAVRLSVATAHAGSDAFALKCVPFVCGPTRLALAASPDYVLSAAWGASNDASGAISVARPNGSIVAGWPKGIDAFLGLPSAPGTCDSGNSCFRTFQAPHAAYDAATGRFWFTVNELTFEVSNQGDAVPRKRFAASNATPESNTTWVAVSRSSDPTGAWNVYRFDTNETGRLISGYSTGFGFDRDAVYVSGKQLDNISGALLDSFVYAIDKRAMQNGADVTARGFANLSYGGTLVEGVVPVHPQLASDERSGTYLVDTFDATKGLVPCAIKRCSGVLVWSFADPLGRQRLTARVARTTSYAQPFNFTNTDFAPLDTSILSMPTLSNGTIDLTFAEGYAQNGRRTNAVRFVQIRPSFFANGSLGVKTETDEDLLAPGGHTLDFPSTARDASGAAYVTYSVESPTDPDRIAYVKHGADGSMSTPTTIFQGRLSTLITGFDLTGYGASAFDGRRIRTLEPYAIPNSGYAFISGWLSTVP